MKSTCPRAGNPLAYKCRGLSPYDNMPLIQVGWGGGGRGDRGRGCQGFRVIYRPIL